MLSASMALTTVLACTQVILKFNGKSKIAIMTTVGSRSSGKYKIFENSQNTVLNCVYQSNVSIKWLQKILQQLDGDYGECAIKIA